MMTHTRGDKLSFKSWNDFLDFDREVKYHARFIRSRKVNAFLRSVKKTLPSRVRNLSAGKFLYRSQIGFVENIDELGKDRAIVEIWGRELNYKDHIGGRSFNVIRPHE